MNTTTTDPAHGRGHLSRHERQRLARAEAFSRRTPAGLGGEVPVKLARDELELIDGLVRGDRTAVWSALLALAGAGASGPIRGAVLTLVREAAFRVQTEGAISDARCEQIARRVDRAQHADGPREEDARGRCLEARVTIVSTAARPSVVEVLRFRDLPFGACARRRGGQR